MAMEAPEPVRLTYEDYLEMPEDGKRYEIRAHIIHPAAIHGAPDLVIEVISRYNRRMDQEVKRQRYAARGIRFYWIVDPAAHVLEEYELVGTAYRLRGRAAAEGTLVAAVFPGLELHSGGIF